jgi:hypothetical protein
LIVNDFNINVATANGSGSQTSNNMLIRSLLQNGHPRHRQEPVPQQHPGSADLVSTSA